MEELNSQKKLLSSFCTLFSEKYLLQGLALITSIKRHHSNSKIWVLALDEKTHLALEELSLENVILLSNYDREQILNYFTKFQETRSYAESIFTTKPYFLSQVLEKVEEDEFLTYVDADTFLFDTLTLDTLTSMRADILLSPHYFNSNSSKNLVYGYFNAGLVGFKNNEIGKLAARKWVKLCAEWCYLKLDNDRFADQKYLESIDSEWRSHCHYFEFGINFSTWSFSENLNFEFANKFNYVNSNKIVLFHFHGFKISKIFLRTEFNRYGKFNNSKSLFKTIYLPYISELNVNKKKLNKLSIKLEPFDDFSTIYGATFRILIYNLRNESRFFYSFFYQKKSAYEQK